MKRLLIALSLIGGLTISAGDAHAARPGNEGIQLGQSGNRNLSPEALSRNRKPSVSPTVEVKSWRRR